MIVNILSSIVAYYLTGCNRMYINNTQKKIKTDKKCKKDDDGKSPGYNLYKDCVARFVREHLDEYF